MSGKKPYFTKPPAEKTYNKNYQCYKSRQRRVAIFDRLLQKWFVLLFYELLEFYINYFGQAALLLFGRTCKRKMGWKNKLALDQREQQAKYNNKSNGLGDCAGFTSNKNIGRNAMTVVKTPKVAGTATFRVPAIMLSTV